MAVMHLVASFPFLVGLLRISYHEGGLECFYIIFEYPAWKIVGFPGPGYSLVACTGLATLAWFVYRCVIGFIRILIMPYPKHDEPHSGIEKSTPGKWLKIYPLPILFMLLASVSVIVSLQFLAHRYITKTEQIRYQYPIVFVLFTYLLGTFWILRRYRRINQRSAPKIAWVGWYVLLVFQIHMTAVTIIATLIRR